MSEKVIVSAWMHFDGPEIFEPLKKHYNQKFMEAYGEFVDIFNPMIEAINVAYDRVCKDLAEDLYDPNSIYMRFFREKMQEVADNVYSKNWMYYGTYFKRFFIGQQNDFRAETNEGTIMWFSFNKEES